VILQVGLDESGYGQTGANEAFIFAGYAGSVTQVKEFTHLWDRVFNLEPVMSVQEIKKRVRLRGAIDPKVRLFSAVVHACRLNGVRYTVSPDDHAAMMKALDEAFPKADQKIRRLRFGGPYFFAFMAVLMALIEMVLNDPDAKIEVIYDENLGEKRKLKTGYRMFRKFLEVVAPEVLAKLAKDPIPRNDEEFSLLQAADALAWHSHRDHVEHANGRRYENEIWSNLNSVPFSVDVHWTREKLLEAVAETARALADP